MKHKYKGMISIGLAAAAMFAILGYYVSGWWQSDSIQPRVFPKSLNSGWKPSKTQMDAIEKLTGRLHLLANPRSKHLDSASLLLFGHHRSDSGSGVIDDSDQYRPSYALSLTLLAGPLRYCIINGEVMVEGARLEDGALIAKIDTQKVLIAKGDELQWVLLNDAPQLSEENNLDNSRRRKRS